MITILEAFEACKAKLTSEENKHTARGYKHAIDVFGRYLSDEFGITLADDVSKIDIQKFIQYPSWLMREKNDFRRATAVVYLSGADYFLEQYLAQERLIHPEMVDIINYQNQKKRLTRRVENYQPRKVAEKDVQKMVEAVQQINDTPIRKARDVAIVLLLSSSGLRNFELCALRCSDVYWDSDYEKPFVHVEKGKDNIKGDVPFSTEAYRAVRSYWKERGWESPGDPAFARHDKGTGKRHQPLTTCSIRLIIKAVRGLSGIENAFTPHYFRHGVATTILRKTGNIKLAQDQLRHTHLGTTEGYAHLLKDDLVSAHNEIFEKGEKKE